LSDTGRYQRVERPEGEEAVSAQIALLSALAKTY